MGGGTEMFKTGKVAMFESGAWPIKDFKEMKDFNVGTVTMPTRDGKLVGVMHASGLVVAKTGKHKDEAIKLATFIGGEDGHKEQGQMGYALPGMPAIAEEIKVNEDPLYKPFMDMLEYCTELPAFMRTENWSKIDEKFSKEALNKAVKEAEEAVKLGKE